MVATHMAPGLGMSLNIWPQGAFSQLRGVKLSTTPHPRPTLQHASSCDWQSIPGIGGGCSRQSMVLHPCRCGHHRDWGTWWSCWGGRHATGGGDADAGPGYAVRTPESVSRTTGPECPAVIWNILEGTVQKVVHRSVWGRSWDQS